MAGKYMVRDSGLTKNEKTEINQEYLLEMIKRGTYTDGVYQLTVGSDLIAGGALIRYHSDSGIVEVHDMIRGTLKERHKSTEKRGYITFQIYKWENGESEEYVCYVHQLAALIKHYLQNKRDDGRCFMMFGGVGNHKDFDHTNNSMYNIEYLYDPKWNEWHGVVVHSIIYHKLLPTKTVVVYDKRGNIKNEYKALETGISWFDIEKYCRIYFNFEREMKGIKLKKNKDEQEVISLGRTKAFVDWLRLHNLV